MNLGRLRSAILVLACGGLALWLAACNSAQPAAPADPMPRAAETDPRADQAREVAEASLGKEAEVLGYGNLAQDGQEQVLAAVRYLKNRPDEAVDPGSGLIYASRVAVLAEASGKWSQVLLCDEHLKNPKGYLGRTGSMLGGGWRLEYRRDPQAGLIMKFSSASLADVASAPTGQHSGQTSPTFEVRWNKSAKRYQLFEQSHERYLSEIPSLETPESILK